jgi:hypothetical protein
LFFPKIIRVIESKKMDWETYVADMVQMKKKCRIRVGKLEGRSVLENLGADRRKMDFIGIGCGGVDCMRLPQGRVNAKRL